MAVEYKLNRFVEYQYLSYTTQKRKKFFTLNDN